MAHSISLVGLDVHASQTHAAVLETATGELSGTRLRMGPAGAAGHPWKPQASEVEQVLELSLSDLMRGFERRRLVRRGVPIRTPTYTVDGHFVWGATARIVEQLLERLAPAL